MVQWMLLAVVMAAIVCLTDTFTMQEIQVDPGNCWKNDGTGSTMYLCGLKDTKVTVQTSNIGNQLSVECQGNTKIACNEFDIVKREIARNIDNSRDTRVILDKIDIENCNIERVKCLLDIVNASDVLLLKLIHMELKPEHLDGLEAVTHVRMTRVGNATNTVPYSALKLLPNLTSFSMLDNANLTLHDDDVILPNITKLELSMSNIKILPKAAFKSTPNIVDLLLFANKINDVHVDAFEGLTNLRTLSLNRNQISHLPGGLFRHTPHLEYVDLYVNSLDELTEDLLSGLQELHTVKLFGNKVPLILKNHAFSNLPSLRVLELNDNSITNLPNNIFSNTTNLKEVKLNGNQLKTLPSDLFSYLNLLTLDLSDNILEILPFDIFRNQKLLKTLYLKNNLLENIPRNLFSMLDNLNELDLSKNLLKSLVDGDNRSILSGLNSLKVLKLGSNNIEIMNASVFKPVENLEIISLANNNITISEDYNRFYELETNIPFNFSPLKDLIKLTDINLSHNNITVMCRDWTQLFFLKKLDLSYNRITSLTEVDMYFASPAKINLQHNRIQHFRPYFDESNINTEKPIFYLNSNPYKCDCNMYDFAKIYTNPDVRKLLILDNAKCAKPKFLYKTNLANLIPNNLTCEIDCTNTSKIHNTTNCSCLERPSESRLEMSCKSFPKTYPKLDKNLNFIHIKLDNITEIPIIPADVKFIDLSNLNLTKSPIAYSIGNNNTIVDLSDNNLTKAPRDLLEKNYVLYLKGNKFDCTCDTESDIALLTKYKYNIKDFKQLSCSDGKLLITKDNLCAERDVIIMSCLIISILIILIIFTITVNKFKTEIRIILRKYGLWFWDDKYDYEFDAYIAFAPEDETIIKEKVIPLLKSGKSPLRLYIHYTNFRIGGFIPDEIDKAIDVSRNTIICLSKNYLNYDWSDKELKTAHTKEKIVFLLLDDLSEMNLDQSMKKLLKLYPYQRLKNHLAIERTKDSVYSRRKRNNTFGPQEKKLGNECLDVHINENGQLENRVPKALHI